MLYFNFIYWVLCCDSRFDHRLVRFITISLTTTCGEGYHKISYNILYDIPFQIYYLHLFYIIHISAILFLAISNSAIYIIRSSAFSHFYWVSASTSIPIWVTHGMLVGQCFAWPTFNALQLSSKIYRILGSWGTNSSLSTFWVGSPYASGWISSSTTFSSLTSLIGCSSGISWIGTFSPIDTVPWCGWFSSASLGCSL